MSFRARRAEGARVAPLPWIGGPVPPASAGAALPAPSEPPMRELPDRDTLASIEREAFAKGFARGEREGLEAGHARADELLRRLGASLEDLANVRRARLRQAERDVVSLALAIARRIVDRQIETDDELLLAMARVALDRLGDAEAATIRLHPEDYGRAVAHLPENWRSGGVTVVADAEVPRGGCRVETAAGFADAGVDAQFQEMARVLIDMPAHV
jgi:flagellar biosynthesis/type III secretory pathway protein FliH